MKTAAEEVIERVKEFNEQNKGLVKEAAEARAAMESIRKDYEEKVKSLNENLAAKDATIGDIQKEVNELKAKSGHQNANAGVVITSVEQLIGKSFESEQGAAILKAGKLNEAWSTSEFKAKMPFKEKAVNFISPSNLGTLNGIVGIPTISTEIAGHPYDDVHFRDLFRVVDSATGTFVFYRTANPPGEGSVQFTSGPGAQKALLDKDFEPITVNARYLAGIVDIAKESLTDIPMLQSYLNEELVQNYLDAETYAFFTALLAQATGSSAVEGSNDFSIEDIVDLIRNQRKARYRPNFVAITPDVWAEIIKTRPNDFSLPNAVVITADGRISIVGIPLTTVNTAAFQSRQVLVGDSRKAAVMQVVGEGLKLELFKQHDKAVYQNMVSLRVEARVAPIVFRPDAFSKATLGAHPNP